MAAFAGFEIEGELLEAEASEGGVAAVHGRAGATPRADRSSVLGLAALEGVGPGLAEALLTALLVPPDEQEWALTADLAHLPDEHFRAALDEAVGADGKPIRGLRAGSLGRLFAAAKKWAAEREATPSGAVPKARPPDPPASTQEQGGRKLSIVVDQSDDTLFRTLPPAEVAKLRAVHVAVTGDDPVPAARPTSDQLSGLHAKLEQGRSPYVDLALFGPYGDRLTRSLRFQGEIFVGSELVKKQLKGPANYEAWHQSWAVFRAAAIMLGVASPATLDRYAEGIRRLWSTHGHWTVIMIADERARAEQWDILAETLAADPPAGYDRGRPWNSVIRASAYDLTGPMAEWWYYEVVAPLTYHVKHPSHAIAMFKGAGGSVSSSSAGPAHATNRGERDSKRRRKEPASGGATPRPPRDAPPGASSQVCWKFNTGECSEPCPTGRLHVCNRCRGPHARTACTSSGPGVKKERSKGRGRGGKGKALPVRTGSGEPASRASPRAGCIFLEVFAGSAVLTGKVRALGIETCDPDDFAHGGTDFRDAQAVDELKARLRELTDAHGGVFLHMAPPCSTFSRARDRRSSTRLRSARCPEGFDTHVPAVRDANEVASNTLHVAEYAAVVLGAAVTVENPATSYLWSFWEPLRNEEVQFTDHVVSMCRYGAAYQKHTKIRSFNIGLKKLTRRCFRTSQGHSCGREHHEVLEFGGGSTRDAAVYPERLCEAWAHEVQRWAAARVPRDQAVDRVAVTAEGRVHRHCLRGASDPGRQEVKRAEDAACQAGLRNPQAFQSDWPSLGRCMALVRAVLLSERAARPELRELTSCCGRAPARAPPPADIVRLVRAEVGRALDTSADVELHHESSPWRFGLVRAVQQIVEDPDVHVADWLQRGAPMGLAKSIEPGGLFPVIDDTPGTSLDDLEAAERWSRNHPSFDGLYDERAPPGIALVQQYVNAGFGELHTDLQAATAALGQAPHPAPLGTVAKRKPDGSVKYRIIQDQRRNGVNAAVRLPERQVLPRPIDHGIDLARLSAGGRPGEVLSVLTLDFKDAFMSIPLDPAEQPYNCTLVEGGVRRERPPLRPDEPSTGTVVVWRVLGFGGRPNPLIYSRAASFAARTGQALFEEGAGSTVRARMQLYVDDPVVAVQGQPSEVEIAYDLLLMWWLCLGIPLAWEKGACNRSDETYTWIGVDYTVRAAGVAVMTLPTAFINELLVQLEPFCKGTGHSSIREAEVVVGRAGRVAHIVPDARPFVGALYAALSASRRQQTGTREAPPGQCARRRFAVGARWLRALLRRDAQAHFVLERRVLAEPAPPPPPSELSLTTDASPWGGGAVLWRRNVPVEFASWRWSDNHAAHLHVRSELPRFQTFWEFLTIGLAMVTWHTLLEQHTINILGDNTASLQDALDLKGKGSLLAISREIAWRKAKFGWKYVVGHLPSEQNDEADALSRIFAPDARPLPLALAHAHELEAADPSMFWQVR